MNKIVPFLVLGVSIAILIALAILLSYVILWGLAIGLVIYGIVFIKDKFFPSKKPTQTKEGRIIEHDENEGK